MAVVAITGLIANGLVWLFPPEPQPGSPQFAMRSGWWVEVVVAGYQIPLTWRVLMAVAGVILSAIVGILCVPLAMFVQASPRNARQAKEP
jgi:hypothetical protein